MNNFILCTIIILACVYLLYDTNNKYNSINSLSNVFNRSTNNRLKNNLPISHLNGSSGNRLKSTYSPKPILKPYYPYENYPKYGYVYPYMQEQYPFLPESLLNPLGYGGYGGYGDNYTLEDYNQDRKFAEYQMKGYATVN